VIDLTGHAFKLYSSGHLLDLLPWTKGTISTATGRFYMGNDMVACFQVNGLPVDLERKN